MTPGAPDMGACCPSVWGQQVRNRCPRRKTLVKIDCSQVGGQLCHSQPHVGWLLRAEGMDNPKWAQLQFEHLVSTEWS